MENETTAYMSDIAEESGAVSAELIAEDWNTAPASRGQSGERENPPAQTNERYAGEPVTRLPEGRDLADSSFKLKHLGREFEVSRDEVITLAQKGVDYDRIRSRADALSAEASTNSGFMDFLKDVSQKAGLTVDEYVAHAGVAQEAASANRADAELKTAEESLTRRDSELSEFVAEYGNIKPEAIPAEVWNEVADGKPLLAAYRSFENRTLKMLLEAGLKNGENKVRSTGSRASAGAASERSELESDWYRD